MKVLTIVGTRPELIKMCRVIPAMDAHTDHVLAHTGQNYDYELNQIFFEELGIRKPDFFLAAAGASAVETIANVMLKADALMAEVKPEALLLYGDTNSCLSVIPAKRRRIPVFHMEAGNRSFDQRVPEELNRKIVDHLSDLNLTLTEHARRYLLDEGLAPERVIKVGGHMQEVLETFAPRIEASNVLNRLDLHRGRYFLVSAHREENVDDQDNLRDLLDALNGVAEAWGFPVVVSTHPRTHNRLAKLGDMATHPLVQFLKPFGFFDYLKLQIEAACVLSDSGTITEEASLLDFPAVTIRYAHERPEGMDQGTLIMCGLKRERVLQAVRVAMAARAVGGRSVPIVPDYEGGPVSQKVLKIVLSYTDYVRRTVWREP